MKRMISMLPHFALFAALAVLAGCTSNPLQTAQTVEQQGDALYGSYVIAKEQGAVLLQDATIPDVAKRPVAVAMVDSKPIGDAGHDVLSAYSEVQSQVAAGKTTDDKLLIAQEKISAWMAKAAPLITKLIDAVKGVWK